MLTDEEREKLEAMEYVVYAMTGNTIDLVSLCEDWLATNNPPFLFLARFLAAGREAALAVLDNALQQPQDETMRALLHALRGYLKEENDEPWEAFSEYTQALIDVPPGEPREAVLEARRRVAYVAN